MVVLYLLHHEDARRNILHHPIDAVDKAVACYSTARLQRPVSLLGRHMNGKGVSRGEHNTTASHSVAHLENLVLQVQRFCDLFG